jgi:hypothetical protein
VPTEKEMKLTFYELFDKVPAGAIYLNTIAGGRAGFLHFFLVPLPPSVDAK